MADKISITICGDGGCGKSSITLRLVRSQWTSEYDPTIEDSYSVTRTVDGLNYYLSLTDTAGQEEYRSLWAASNLQSDAFLLVYDITNAASLEGLQWFLDMIDIEAENRLEENARLLSQKGSKVRGKREEGWKFPPIKIVAGNKCDLKDARVVSSKVGWEWAKSKNCGFMETSAREMVNIEETFACKYSISLSHERS
jgi:GTPase KRas